MTKAATLIKRRGATVDRQSDQETSTPALAHDRERDDNGARSSSLVTGNLADVFRLIAVNQGQVVHCGPKA
jgi:hypothetical protein